MLAGSQASDVRALQLRGVKTVGLVVPKLTPEEETAGLPTKEVWTYTASKLQLGDLIVAK
jgi:hypothetical protein